MNATAWRTITAVGLMILGGIGVAQTTAPEPTGQVEEIKAIEARLKQIQQAAQSLDAEKVFRFVLENDNGALVESGRVLLTRDEALQSTKQGFSRLRQVSYRFDHQHITLLSPTVAIAVGDGVTTALTKSGDRVNTRFAQSVVLVKADGEWKVAHAHRSFPAAP